MATSLTVSPESSPNPSAPADPPRRVLVLAPQVEGRDGVAEVTRQVIEGLAEAVGPAELEVWSLHDAHAPGRDPSRGRARYRCAGGSRLRLAAWGARETWRGGPRTLAFSTHLHLAPVLGPARMRGARTAVFLHGIEAWEPLAGARRQAVRHATHLLANSRRTAMRFLDANPGLDAPEVRVCPLGARDDPSPGSRTAGGPARPYALIVGRMASKERYKGHDLLLEAWPAVLEAVPDARLVVVGDGDDRPRLESKARGLKLSGHVEFAGSVDDDRLAACYRDCEFFVMPSRGEGFGLVYLEAMRASKACLGVRGVADEIIRPGETGALIEPDDRASATSVVVRWFRDAGERARLGLQGRRRYEERFTDRAFRTAMLDALGIAPPRAAAVRPPAWSPAR